MPQKTFFWQAIVSAAMLHLLCLFAFLLTWKGAPQDYQLDLSFLDNILRPQEISSPVVSLNPREEETHFLPRIISANDFERTAWVHGSVIEKPMPIHNALNEKSSPLKFLAESSEITESRKFPLKDGVKEQADSLSAPFKRRIP